MDIQPDLIIEIGTLNGGGALYYADLLYLLGKGEIHTINVRNEVYDQKVFNHNAIKFFNNGFENYDLNLTKGFKKILVIILLFSVAQVALAVRGAGKRNRSKSILNIVATNTSLRNSIALNLRTGLNYKGSLLFNTKTATNSVLATTLVSYQKGNITYVIPYSKKIIMPEMHQGYTGMKVILRHN
jgi:hypothetical protein